MDNIFTGIKALVQAVSSLYAANVIFKGFNNSYALPTDSNFVIMNQLPNIKSHCLLPEYNYDGTAEIESWTQIDSASFQVDFYGINAITVSAAFRAALQSAFGTNFLNQNGYECVVGEVKETYNLTDIIDREMFTARYAVAFTLQFTNAIATSTPGATEVNIDVVFADVQTPT